ncbi:MAG: tetratricopeptide repeat protein [Litorimonas sp.]
MNQPLALPGEGLHFVWVKAALSILAVCLFAAPALAQVEEATPETQDEQVQDRPNIILDRGPTLIDPITPLPAPDLPPDVSDLPDPDQSIPEAPTPEVIAPDYSRLSSNEERAARLDDMFARLRVALDADSGNLIAEEIWAVWLNSGSASVNLLLRRGADAQTRNSNQLARVMYDHVTKLEPEYAEGWARSSRLALEERDFARAAGEAVRALTLEPRHFYALWTLGNVLERLGRQDDALEAYREANQLYPTLESVSERVDALEAILDGGIL